LAAIRSFVAPCYLGVRQNATQIGEDETDIAICIERTLIVVLTRLMFADNLDQLLA
jgi:hypothetical protein